MVLYDVDVPDEYINSVVLYVACGSLNDGDKHGLAHFTEHVLVSADKLRNNRNRRFLRVSARVSYRYMFFEVRYDSRYIAENYAETIIEDIALEKFIAWELLEECRLDIIDEWFATRKCRQRFPKKTRDKRIVDNIPLGDLDAIVTLTSLDIKTFLLKYYSDAEKYIIYIRPNMTLNKYEIDIKKKVNITKRRVMQEDDCAAREYIYDDIVYIIGANALIKENRIIIWSHNILDRKYFEIMYSETNGYSKSAFLNKKNYLKGFNIVKEAYQGINMFEYDIMLTIVVEALELGRGIFQIGDIQKITNNSAVQFYDEYKNKINSAVFL